MALRAKLACVVAVFMAGLAPACGGKTVVASGDSVEPSDDDADVTADASMGTHVGLDGSVCIDVEVAPSDLSCGSDQDCALIRNGEVCSGQCDCGDTPVNATAANRYETATTTLPSFGGCACGILGVSRCLGGQCTLCNGSPHGPAACGNVGYVTIDGGIDFVDGGACVDIDLSTYDRSCNQASDCIAIRAGEVCTGQCACGDPLTLVNASEQSRYEQATSGIRLDAVCPCPPVALGCIGNVCITAM